MTVPAGHEDEDTCQSWTLDNATELWVSTITQHNDGAYHHVNWFIVPDTTFVVPDGTWTCSAQGFEEVQAALLGGYLFTQSTQSHDETQTMPTGSAIRIPPRSRLIGASHLLNTSDSELHTTLHLSVRTIPPVQVTAKLAPARIQYHDLHLDASARSSFTTECDLAASYPTALGPFHYTLYFVFSHYHSLGDYTEMQVLGGPSDGQVIMHHDGLGNFGTTIDPPSISSRSARGCPLHVRVQQPARGRRRLGHRRSGDVRRVDAGDDRYRLGWRGQRRHELGGGRRSVQRPLRGHHVSMGF